MLTEFRNGNNNTNSVPLLAFSFPNLEAPYIEHVCHKIPLILPHSVNQPSGQVLASQLAIERHRETNGGLVVMEAWMVKWKHRRVNLLSANATKHVVKCIFKRFFTVGWSKGTFFHHPRHQTFCNLLLDFWIFPVLPQKLRNKTGSNILSSNFFIPDWALRDKIFFRLICFSNFGIDDHRNHQEVTRSKVLSRILF